MVEESSLSVKQTLREMDVPHSSFYEGLVLSLYHRLEALPDHEGRGREKHVGYVHRRNRGRTCPGGPTEVDPIVWTTGRP